jgi:ABC-type multidrug transport system ATPase subunit
MSVWQQFVALVKKNLLLKRRRVMQTMSEIFYPIYIIGILVLIKVLNTDSVDYAAATFDATQLINGGNATSRPFAIPNGYLAYVDLTNSNNSNPSNGTLSFNASSVMADTLNLLQSQQEIVGLFNASSLQLRHCSDAADLADFYHNHSFFSFFAAVEFLPDHAVAIRFNQTLIPATEEVLSDASAALQCRLNTSSCNARQYIETGFVALQIALTGALAPSLRSLRNITATQFPVEPYRDTSSPAFLKVMLGIYFVLAFTPLVQYLATNVVGEKQRKIQVHLQTVGMTSTAHFGSWFAVYVGLVTVSVTIVTIMAVASSLINVPPVELFFLLWVYAISLLAFGFVVAAVINADKAAGLVASLGSLLLALPQYALPYVPFAAQYVIALSSPAALSMTLTKAITDDGFDTFFSSSEWTVGSGIVMMLIDTVLYLLLALYLDAVWPYRDFGVPRHPLFCVGGGRSGAANERDMDHMDGGGRDGDAHADPRDFEVLQYSASDVAVSLADVQKHYGEKKAVRGVSLDLLKGEIVGLLGQNGAGKSSLISVMTGVLPATSGSVSIFGVDLAVSPTAARSALGVCAQSDILFDELTVIEHMRLFASIKGVSKLDTVAHIDALLHDVGLAREHQKFAKDLSGGMKRKLSLALALVGQPKLLVLDEVTAAMDPFSRQQVWKLLRRDAASRVTLMSTHFMDEADQVCDRKAIMRNGRLVMAGTSMFLKARFGLGYALTLGTDSAKRAAEAREWLTRELPGGANAEIKIEKHNVFVQLPPSESAAFPPFFRKLTAAKQELGIADVDLNLPTLESVFLKLQNDADEQDKALGAEKRTLASDAHDESQQLLHDRGRVVPRTSPSFLQQLGGLFVARTQLKMREPKFYVFGVVLPVAFMVIGTVLGGMNAPSTNTPLAPTPLDFGAHLASLANASAHPSFGVLHGSTPSFVAKLPSVLPHNVSLPVVASGSNASVVDQFLRERAASDNSTVLGVLGDDAGSASVAVWHNSSVISTLPALVQAALLAAATEAVNVSVVSVPLPGGTLSFDTSSFMGVLFLSMGLTFTIGSYAIDPIRDRQSGTKHQLTLMGMKRAAYWLSFLVSDMSTYVLISVAAVIMVHAVPMAAFTGAALPAFLVLLVLFIPAAIMMAYTLSFIFGTKVDAAVSTLPPVINVAGVIAFVAVAITDMTGSTNAAQIAHYVLSFAVPPYALSGGLYFIVRVSMLVSVGAITQTVTTSTYFEWDRNVAVSMTAMAVHLVVFALLIVFLDRHSDRARASVVSGKIKYDDESERAVDSDVAAEAERVRKLLADGVHRDEAPPLIVSGVSKAFQLRETVDAKKKPEANGADVDHDADRDVERGDGNRDDGANLEIARRRKSAAVRDGTVGTIKRVRTAVDNVSFAVEEGHVIALLGVNGAGKTTLLSTLVGDLAADSGEAFIVGEKVGTNNAACFDAVGCCPQKDALFDLLTVEQHLRLYARIKGLPAPLIDARIQYLLDMMQIVPFRRVVAKKLSGGTKRKLSLAIALVAGPRVLFLDEPSAGVDVSAKRFLWDVIRANAPSQAVVLTTHSLEEAEALSDRVMIMVNGAVQCIGSAAHLRQRFGRGVQLEVKSAVATAAAVSDVVKERFGGDCELLSSFFGTQRFRINHEVELEHAFEIIDSMQRDAALRIEFVTVSPTTLEQVFIEFAKLQLQELRI